MKIKICGITNAKDAATAIEAGADAIGFIFYAKSPRACSKERARDIIATLPPFVTTVGVFVNEPLDMVKEIKEFSGLAKLQLHGEEGPEYCESISGGVIKAFRVGDTFNLEDLKKYKVEAFLLDTFVEGTPGGTAKTFDWKVAVEAKRYGRVILSGGLTPENITEAIERVEPYAVDVSSGVEHTPGIKDRELIRRFIEGARGNR